MKYQERAELERIEEKITDLNKEYDDLRNQEAGIQFREEDIRKELKDLEITKAELNLTIARNQ